MDIHALLAQMTLEEKLGQMTQIPPHYFLALSEAEVYGTQRELDLTKEQIVLSGSILGIGNREEMIKIQTYILKHSRLKIPALFMADIIHGYKTIFPIPLAQAASFNPEVVKKANEISALEASTAGIHVTFSPMVDLARDARWGRVLEGYGEDPLLNVEMTRAAIEGYHRGNPKDNGYLATCFKHFAGYGASEAGRDYNSVDMSYERFYNIYRPSYQEAIHSGSEMVMLAFNTFNGIPSTINTHLTKTILKDQMGFKGVVISDYDALHQTVAHGAASDDYDAARLGIQAGLDIEMGSNTYIKQGVKLYQDGLLDIKLVDEAVLRILSLKRDLGLFENPFKGALEDNLHVVKSEAHMHQAEILSYESPVLLKNEGILPLHDTKHILLTGPFVETRSFLGAWHWHGDERDNHTYLEAFEALKHSISYHTSSYALDACKPYLPKVDTVILMIGESQKDSGEAKSKVGIHLDPHLKEVISTLKSQGKKVISVIHGGRPLVIEPVLESDAILYTWFLGSRHTEVVSKILLGHINPSGKLPMSLPRHVGQYPMSYHDFNTGRPFDPIHNEYVTKYLDVLLTPQFEFGYGLTYANVELTTSFHKTQWNGEKPLTLDITLENHSALDTKETILIYGTIHPSMPVRPLKKLIQFKKVALKQNESKTIQFQIDKEAFIIYDELNQRHLGKGKMTLYIGLNPYELKRYDLDWRPL